MKNRKLPCLKDLDRQLSKLRSGEISIQAFTRNTKSILSQLEEVRRYKKRNIKTKKPTTTREGKREYMRIYMRRKRRGLLG